MIEEVRLLLKDKKKKKKKKLKGDVRLNSKRFLKKRRRKEVVKKKKKKNVPPTNFQFSQLSKKNYTTFISFNNKRLKGGREESLTSEDLTVPKILSFIQEIEGSFNFFRKLNYVLYNRTERVVIDFQKCQHISISAVTYLQIILDQFLLFQERYNKSNYLKLERDIVVKRSKDTNVNKMLYAIGIIDGLDENDDVEQSSFLTLGLKTLLKSRSNYKENKKGKTCADVIKFVNRSLAGLGCILDEAGSNIMDNLVSEILGNAEDHSKLNQFYVNGVSFKEEDEQNEDCVVELNLAIINFGYSMYEGFMNTRSKNSEIDEAMEALFSIHEEKLSKLKEKKKVKHYNKESLFTLYGLQEGISRLKFKDSSRGNGTMNFIRAFMNLGKFGEENPQYESRLNVISGHTAIECTNKYKPYRVEYPNGGVFFRLSLNDDKDIKELPDEKCIFVNENYFPGTILQVKVYLNKKYLMKIIENDK